MSVHDRLREIKTDMNDIIDEIKREEEFVDNLDDDFSALISEIKYLKTEFIEGEYDEVEDSINHLLIKAAEIQRKIY